MKNNKLYNRAKQYLKPYRLPFYSYTLIYAASSFIVLSAIGILLSDVFNNITSDAKFNPAQYVIYFILILVCAIAYGVSSVCFVQTEQKVQASIRGDMIDSYLNADELSVAELAPDEIRNRINQDIPKVSLLFGYYMAGYVYQPFLTGLICVVYLAFIDIRVVLLCFACAVLGFFSVTLFAKQRAEEEEKITISKSGILRMISENVNGKAEVRIHHLANSRTKIVDNGLNGLSKHVSKMNFYENVRSFFIFLTVDCISYLSIIVLGAYLSANGFIDFGDVLVALPMVDLIWQMITAVGTRSNFITEARSHLERIFEIIDLPKGTDHRKDGKEIAFENVSFSYDGTAKALSNVSFTIHKGEKTAIVGESGSGKSTIMKLLLGLYQAEDGEVRIPSDSIVSYMPQKINVMGTSISENIALSDTYDKDKIVQAAKSSGADEFISRLDDGYDHVGDSGNTGFSGGQLQRLSLARCFYKDADILLMDEPTSAMDEDAMFKIRDFIDTLDKNYTVIVITHELRFTEHFDNIIVMDHGVIAEEGTHSSLMKKNGTYQRLREINQQH